MSQCYLLLIGGYETVGSALSFALYHIVRDPQIEEKVLQEIHEVLGDKVSKVYLSKDNYMDLSKEKILFSFLISICNQGQHEQQLFSYSYNYS